MSARLGLVTATCCVLGVLAWSPARAQDAVATPGAPTDAAAAAATEVVENPAASTETDEIIPFKLSLPTESDRVAWSTAGFRVQMGGGYGTWQGLSGAPSGSLLAYIVRLGARLDADWSLVSSLHLARVNYGNNSAFRYAGTVDPTWHATENLEFAIGFGFAGIIEANTGRPDPDAAQRNSLVSSYTLLNTYPPVPSCNGVGTAALARAAWNIVLGPMSAGSVALEFDGQWTACSERLGQVEPDTAQTIYRRQWWPQLGGTLAWLFAWR